MDLIETRPMTDQIKILKLMQKRLKITEQLAEILRKADDPYQFTPQNLMRKWPYDALRELMKQEFLRACWYGRNDSKIELEAVESNIKKLEGE